MTISSSIEIDAAPEFVRSTFLDFPKLSEWHTDFIKSVKSLDPARPTGHNLVPGDKLDSKITAMTFHQTIQENSPQEFRTIGPFYGLLTGVHGYRFEPSSTNPGGTTFTQWEEFSGILAWSMASYMPGGKKTLAAFQGVNADLKKHVESLAR